MGLLYSEASRQRANKGSRLFHATGSLRGKTSSTQRAGDMTFLAFTGLTLGSAIVSGAFFCGLVFLVTYLETRK